jgi:hypothetical protein
MTGVKVLGQLAQRLASRKVLPAFQGSLVGSPSPEVILGEPGRALSAWARQSSTRFYSSEADKIKIDKTDEVGIFCCWGAGYGHGTIVEQQVTTSFEDHIMFDASVAHDLMRASNCVGHVTQLSKLHFTYHTILPIGPSDSSSEHWYLSTHRLWEDHLNRTYPLLHGPYC